MLLKKRIGMVEDNKQQHVPQEHAQGEGTVGPGEGIDVHQSQNDPAQLLEALQRVQADFINYKRRTEEDREEQQRYSNSRLIIKLLPVLDEFVLAIDHASKSGSAPSWLEGISLIQRKLNSLLESENVVKIQAEGKAFDPFEHEAMAYQESTEYPEGHVMSVVRNGYKMHGRVLRPALVILARQPEGPTSPRETQEKEN
jgi:molecular chaperone GrpE